MKCGNCGFSFGGDRQMIIVIPNQIIRCPRCGKLVWQVGDDALDNHEAFREADESERDEPE